MNGPLHRDLTNDSMSDFLPVRSLEEIAAAAYHAAGAGLEAFSALGQDLHLECNPADMVNSFKVVEGE